MAEKAEEVELDEFGEPTKKDDESFAFQSVSI